MLLEKEIILTLMVAFGWFVIMAMLLVAKNRTVRPGYGSVAIWIWQALFWTACETYLLGNIWWW